MTDANGCLSETTVFLGIQALRVIEVIGGLDSWQYHD